MRVFLALRYQSDPALLCCHVGPAVDSDAVQASPWRQTQARHVQPTADPQDRPFPWSGAKSRLRECSRGVPREEGMRIFRTGSGKIWSQKKRAQ